jgi:hypothetical protein
MIEYGDKPLRVRLGTGYRNDSENLLSLVCERWEEVRRAFGPSCADRFGNFGLDEGELWDRLAPYINASSSARRDFLIFCDQADGTLGLRSFVALAKEQPSGQVLLDHCWRAFGPQASGRHERQSPRAVKRIRLEIIYVLRDQFRGRADIKDRLREMSEQGHNEAIVALAFFEPNDPFLDRLRYGPKEIAQQFSDWTSAIHLAAVRSGADEFVELVLAMVNRDSHDSWDFQDVMNRVIVERLQRDREAVEHLKHKLTSNPTENETASLPRYLVAAGALDDSVYEQCRLLLRDEARHALLRAGYDAVADSTQAVSLSLLEIMAPSFFP